MNKLDVRVAIYVAELDIRGGTHKQILKLAQYLNRSGYPTTIYTPCYTADKTYPEFSDLDVVSLRSKVAEREGLMKLLGGLVDQFKLFLKSRASNIVNIHDVNTTFFILLHAFFGKAKQVWQINDIEPAFGIGNSKNYKGRLAMFRRFFSKIAASVVNRITVNVTKNAERVQKHLGQNATVVYCGVDFLPKRVVVPDICNSINIVSTGVVFRFRNYESLIKAAAIVAEKSSKKVRLDIVGDTRHDTEYVSELKRLAEVLSVDVDFAGSVTQEKLNQIYEKAHVFSFVNVDQSWGLAVFEAASMGLPVVLSKSVGAVELLANKSGIEVIDPQSPEEIANAILQITNTEDAYCKSCDLVANAVQNMTWDVMYSKNVESIFIDVLKKG